METVSATPSPPVPPDGDGALRARRTEEGARMSKVRRAAALYREAVSDPMACLPKLRRGSNDPDELVRHVAAVQLAFNHSADLPPAGVRELLDTLVRVSQVADESALTPEYAAATDDGEDCWDLGQHIALALACLPAGSADYAVPELVALWRRDRQFYEAVLAAVALSFPEVGCLFAATLSESQRTVLVALTEDEPVWTCCMVTASLLEVRGLPRTRRGLQSFLASAGGPT